SELRQNLVHHGSVSEPEHLRSEIGDAVEHHHDVNHLGGFPDTDGPIGRRHGREIVEADLRRRWRPAFHRFGHGTWRFPRDRRAHGTGGLCRDRRLRASRPEPDNGPPRNRGRGGGPFDGVRRGYPRRRSWQPDPWLLRPWRGPALRLGRRCGGRGSGLPYRHRMVTKPRIDARASLGAGILGRQPQPGFTLLAHGPFFDALSSPRSHLKTHVRARNMSIFGGRPRGFSQLRQVARRPRSGRPEGAEMGIRTGKQFLDALRDGREIWIDGERVSDVTTDRRFAGAAHSLAELYEMQHAPALADRLTYKSPSTGERVGLSFIQPKTIDELVRRREMVKIWMDATCGMFGRSPDFMNIQLAGFACAKQEFGLKEPRFADNVWNYYLHCRENDIAMTHTLINPQIDRSKPVEQQEKDLAAKVVRETDAGIVIRGARMVSTLCAFSDDLMVMPSSYI